MCGVVRASPQVGSVFWRQWCARLHTVRPQHTAELLSWCPEPWEGRVFGRLELPAPDLWAGQGASDGVQGPGENPGPSRTDLAAVGQTEMSFPSIKPDTTHPAQELRQG